MESWEAREALVTIFKTHLELEAGILPRSIVKPGVQNSRSIDEALAQMTPDEARRCKRAYRKQVRAVKADPNMSWVDFTNKARVTSAVYSRLGKKARAMVKKITSSSSS